MGSTLRKGDGLTHRRSRHPTIALFSPSLGGGGAERVLINLAGGMVDKGIEVDIVLASATGPFLSDVPAGVRVVDLKVSRVARSVLPLARYLRATKPDVLLGFLDHTNVTAIAASFLSGSHTPVFVAVHHTWTRSAAGRLNKDRLFASIARLAYRRAAGVIAVSSGAARAVETCLGIDSSRVRVIYNPVVTSDLFSKAVDSVEHPWFRPGQPPVILGMGRLTKVKDFRTLITAFARLRSRRTARLVILGEGEERPVLEALVKQLGLSENVALPGFVSNPYPYLRKAAVFVLSSVSEALPSVLIEALALGVPIVSTDCPSGPSEILNTSEHGILVRVGDSQQMADAIFRAVTSARVEQDASAWNRFTVPFATAAYLDALL